MQLFPSHYHKALAPTKMKQEDPPLVPRVQSNLIRRGITHQKREGRCFQDITQPQITQSHLASACSSIKWARCLPCVPHQAKGLLQRESHGNTLSDLPGVSYHVMTAAPTETTHLLNTAPRTKSQMCNQPKVLPICTNSLQFSFVPREASIFLSFAALRTNGFCFLKVSFFFFKHILRNIRTPKESYI